MTGFGPQIPLAPWSGSPLCGRRVATSGLGVVNGIAQKGYLRNGSNEVWHCGADFRMFHYHGHRTEVRRPLPPVGSDRK